MPVIKRYPNRKLYDTEAKQYITLDGIADLIRSGKEIHVVDNATGEDLTARTLTQIIFEQEKSQGGLLPRSVLAGVIRAGGDSLSALQRSLLTPRNFLMQVDEEIKRRIQSLIGQGELPEADGKNLLSKLIPPAGQHLEKADFQEEVTRVLSERNLPTRQELDKISAQLESLAEKLEEIGAQKD